MQKGSSSLLLACRNGHIDVVQELMRKGAEVNTKDKVSLLRGT